MRSAVLLAALLQVVTSLPASLDKRFEDADGPRVVQYVQTFHQTNGQPLSLLPLLNDRTGVTHVNLAAVHTDDPPGRIHLNDNSPNDTMFARTWREVSILRQNGVRVLYMLGGAAQGSYYRLCGTNVPAVINNSYYLPLLAELRYHALDGIDLDIEESVDISCPLALLHRLHADMGDDFLLTMAPVASGLRGSILNPSGFDYLVMDRQANEPRRPNRKLVSWYNAQFYNGWGDAGSTSFYQSVISSSGLSPSRITLGLLDNSADGGGAWYPLSTYKATITALRKLYFNFGGTMAWEYFDAGGTDGLSAPDQWVANISAADTGRIFPWKARRQSSAPTPDEPTQPPWPDAYAILKKLGAEHFAIIWALNATVGNLGAAATKLNLTLT